MLNRLVSCCVPLMILLAVACGGGEAITKPSVPNDTGPNFITLVPQASNYLLLAHAYEFSQANTLWSVTLGPGRFTARLEGDIVATADFRITEDKFRPGTYSSTATGTQRLTSVSWAGAGYSCGSGATGTLNVESAVYVGDTLSAMTATYESHCAVTGADGLSGIIHWRWRDSTVAAGPSPIPDTLWKPPANVTPATGDYIYLDGDQGDFILHWDTRLYLGKDWKINTALGTDPKGPVVAVAVDQWGGIFQGMNSLPPHLVVGFYPNLQRAGFNNPVRGGLDWSGFGRGCNELTGWFVIDRIVYGGPTGLAALDLRFEQHCGGGKAALHGKIHLG